MGGGYTSTDQPIIVYLTGTVFGSWGLLGVDLFLVISAWFLASQPFRSKKVISISFQTFTWVFGYSVLYVLYHLFYLHDGVGTTVFEFCRYSLIGFFQPFWCQYYWFVTTYFFLLLLSPIFNKLLEVLQKSQVEKLLLIFIFVPVYAQYSTSAVCDVFRFAYVYLLIGYIKKYGSKTIEKYAKAPVYIFLILLVLVSKCVQYFLPSNKVFASICTLLNRTVASTGRHSMIILIIAMLIFFDVLRRKPTYNRTVNHISSHCLGVYLFHENNLLGLPNTLDVIFRRSTSLGYLTLNSWFPVQFTGIVVCVFIVGILLEWLRELILQKPFMKYVSKKWTHKMEAVDAWFNTL